MTPPSLLSMAQRACMRSIAGLLDVGEISYDLLRPVLKKIDNPQQLYTIETNSPHIADADSELWRAFIARDVPQWEQKTIEPKNPRSWWKVYRKLVREERRAKEEQEEQLLATFTGIDKQKEANQTTFVQKVIPQQGRAKAFVDGVRNAHTNSWGQAKKPALQNAKRGKDILSAIRRQSSNAAVQRGAKPVQPAKALLPQAKSQIKHAPELMVRDYSKPTSTAAARQQAQAEGSQVTSTPPRIFVSRNAPSSQERAIRDALRAEQAKKEERLRTLTGSGSKTVLPTAMSKGATTIAPSVSAQSRTLSSEHAPHPPKPNGESPRPLPVPAIAESQKGRLSPSPAPSLKRRAAPPVSVFMPQKKKKRL